MRLFSNSLPMPIEKYISTIWYRFQREVSCVVVTIVVYFEVWTLPQIVTGNIFTNSFTRYLFSIGIPGANEIHLKHGKFAIFIVVCYNYQSSQNNGGVSNGSLSELYFFFVDSSFQKNTNALIIAGYKRPDVLKGQFKTLPKPRISDYRRKLTF